MIETENGQLTLHENSYPKLYTTGGSSYTLYHFDESTGQWYKMQDTEVVKGIEHTFITYDEISIPWYKRLWSVVLNQLKLHKGCNK